MCAGETSPYRVTIEQLLDRITENEKADVEIAGKHIAKKDVDLDILMAAARTKAPIAISFFQLVGHYFGRELGTVIALLDPQMIVIGGKIAQLGDVMREPLEKSLEESSWLGLKRNFTIKFAVDEPETDRVTLGAATLILQQIFHNPVIKATL